MRHRSVVLVGLAASFFVSREASAATCTWQSTASAAWSLAANWSCGHAPIAIDDAVFPGGAGLQLAINQDVVPQATVSSVSVTGGAYSFTGKPLLVKTGINTIAQSGPLFALPIKLTQDATITNGAGGSPAFTGGIDLGANALTFIAGAFEIDVVSVISGTGSIVSSGKGKLVLDAANTYTGLTTISAGTTRITQAQSLGATDSATSLSGTGTIESAGLVTIDESLLITSTAAGPVLKNTSGGTLTWTGPITTSVVATFDNASANAFTIGGHVSGAGGIKATGTSLDIAGPSNNFNAGFTAATTGSVTVIGTTTPFGGGPLVVANGSSIVLKTTGSIPNAVHLLGAGPSAAVSPLRIATGAPALNGALTLEAGSSIDVTGGATFTLAAGVTGPGALTKRGSGALHLASACTTTAGATLVNDGSLVLDTGDVLPDDAAVTILAGATLVGSGAGETISSFSGAGKLDVGNGKLTFGNGKNQTFSGTIAGSGGNLVKQGAGMMTLIGDSGFGGTLAVSNGTMQLTTASIPATIVVTGAALGATTSMTGSLSLDGTTTFLGRSQTKLTVNGAVALGNAKLDLAFSSEPVPGDQLVLIENDGNDPVTGTFAALAEGAVFAASGVSVQITYKGGTGNDVVVTVVDPAADAGPPPLDAGVDSGSVDAGSDASAGDDDDDDDGDGGDGDAGVVPVPATDAGASSSSSGSVSPSSDAGAGSHSTTDAGATSGDAGDASDDGGCAVSLGRSAAPGGMGVFFLAALAAAFIARKRRGRR